MVGEIHDKYKVLSRIFSCAKIINVEIDPPKVHSELITKEKMMYREGFQETVVPVVTMVLYFGTETRWNKPTNIKALMDIPRWLDP